MEDNQPKKVMFSGINLDDPETKSQLISLVPFFDFDKPEQLANAMMAKLSPELTRAAIDAGTQLYNFLDELLDCLEAGQPSEEFSDTISDGDASTE